MTARKQAENRAAAGTVTSGARSASATAGGVGKPRATPLASAGVGAAGMITKSKRKRSTRPVWTKAQQESYQKAVETLEAAGFRVRREELKRGHCWRVVSGACRSRTDHYIFVDSRLSAQEQIAFLNAKAREVEAPEAAPAQPDQSTEPDGNSECSGS